MGVETNAFLNVYLIYSTFCHCLDLWFNLCVSLIRIHQSWLSKATFSELEVEKIKFYCYLHSSFITECLVSSINFRRTITTT